MNNKPLKFIEKIFSIKNNDYYKMLCVLGVKIKLPTPKLIIRATETRIKQLENNLENTLDKIEELKNQLQGILRMRRHTFDDSVRDNISMQEHNDNVANLLKNLDSKASLNCQKILDRLDTLYYNQTMLVQDMYDKNEIQIINECRKFRKQAKWVDGHWENGKYKLPINFFEPSVFYHRNGVVAIQNPAKINGKTILDVGCYVCDSVLVFREEFPDSPIISFEPSEVNYNLAVQTIGLNNLQNVKVENIGLGDKNCTMSISIGGGGEHHYE